jgi:hypothetical protein
MLMWTVVIHRRLSGCNLQRWQDHDLVLLSFKSSVLLYLACFPLLGLQALIFLSGHLLFVIIRFLGAFIYVHYIEELLSTVIRSGHTSSGCVASNVLY